MPDSSFAPSDMASGFILGNNSGTIKYNPIKIRPYHQ